MVVGLCLVIITVASDDHDGDNSYYAGTASSTNGGVDSEICNNDLTTFLPPPYSNLTNVVCKPIWNTFVLRVSLMFWIDSVFSVMFL